MSKRFGRSQRRKMKEELATAHRQLRLTAEGLAICNTAYRNMRGDLVATKNQLAVNAHHLLALQQVSWAPAATGAEAFVIPEENVTSWDETTRYSATEHMYERTADLSLLQFTMTEALADRLAQRYRDYRDVSWRGIAWRIVDISSGRDYGGRNFISSISESTISVRLIAKGAAS